MSEKYVVRLKNAAIYHADNPFGSTSAEKLMRRGEMVLSDVNLCVAPGEFVYLIGRVGSGKSTLLKTLYAEVQLLSGEGRVAGYDLRRLRRRDIPYLRRRIGIVFQDYQLLTDRNVFMNLYYVMKATGWKREDQIRERIDQVLKLVDLGAKSYKMPFELSGGEQQRLVIARALLSDPQVLLRRGEMVLSDVNLCVAPGEFVYLIGRVGSGKSTLLKTLYAEVQLLSGEGRVAGYDLRRLRRRDIPYLRRRIGIVFQDYQLLTDRNVFMNLYYVMKATGWKREDQIRERIDQVLKLVDLGAKSYKMPFELSGGEQQRLVIARALLSDPQVLLADEPTGNLDPVTAEGIMRLFQEIAGRGCAVVMSTHNTALIENYPARAILFAQGKIREVDLKAELG